MAKRHLNAPIGPSVALVQEMYAVPGTEHNMFPELEYRDMKLTCFKCPGLPTRLVTSTFISQPRVDATQAYRLICGHSAID